MKAIYTDEYLRLPTAADIKNILNCHYYQHGINGMFGSLDCMHTVWKNCPVGWQGSYQGAKGKPTIVLEAICDYQMWFWHAAFGYVGTMNDKTILDLSPFLEGLVDGTFVNNEKESMPYQVGKEKFDQSFILVDGIYPTYARFVKSMTEPVFPRERTFSRWQESARKDIERAFGVLQGKFQYVQRPLMELRLDKIGRRMSTCLLLHNMCVSDRVMDGDVRAWYDPSNSFDCPDTEVGQPDDLERVQRAEGVVSATERPSIGLGGRSSAEVNGLTRREAWTKLRSVTEHSRLQAALMDETSKLSREYFKNK